jgi:Ca2+-binding RTX toxin-like protein
MYGDRINFVLHIEGNELQSAIENFGDDALFGGSGNDVLIGDFKINELIYTSDGSNISREFHLGKDTLNGGSGDDTLFGEYVSFTNGLVTDVITYANDTFVFSLNGNFGKDVIEDMNAGGVQDTLKFTDVKNVGAPTLDAADVNARISAFVANGDGNLVVKFIGGAQITFEDVAYTGQNNILQVVDAAHLVIV